MLHTYTLKKSAKWIRTEGNDTPDKNIKWMYENKGVYEKKIDINNEENYNAIL